jgi:hypothetical protein
MTDTLTLVCAKHGVKLEVGKQKVPGQVEVVPCPDCLWEAYIRGQNDYKKQFVVGG